MLTALHINVAREVSAVNTELRIICHLVYTRELSGQRCLMVALAEARLEELLANTVRMTAHVRS